MSTRKTRGAQKIPHLPNRHPGNINPGKGMGWQFSAPQARPPRTDPTDPGMRLGMAVPAPSRPNGLKGNRRNRFPPKRRPRPLAWVCASARSARTRTRAKPSRASPARVGRMATRLAPFSPCVLGSGAPKIRSNPGSKAGPTDGDPAMRRIAVVGPCRPLLPGAGRSLIQPCRLR